MSWVSLTADVPELHSELTQSLMYDFGAEGLELRDAAHQVMPTVRPPAPGEAIIIAYFQAEADAAAARQALCAKVTAARVLIEPVIERDWSTEWRSQIKSVTVGRLWVGPPWEKATAPKNKVRLFIEPKMAFGTGDHPTTRLCLEAVDRFLADHPTASVLDVGTGTGVLAFAAKKLGAQRVVGIDNDEHSVELALECADENGLTGVQLSTQSLTAISGQFDLVLANILANTLIELAPLLAPKVKQRLVLAGVLAHQADEVSAAFLAQGLTQRPTHTIGEWIRLEFDAAAVKKPSRRAAPKKPTVRERATRKLTRAPRGGTKKAKR
jgi:ribosomal protein L11 methyltransferase